MFISNYHTHTNRCRHANGTDEDFVACAIKGGFNILGFADHSPWPFTDGYISPKRMRIDELDNYVSSIRKLENKYVDIIDIKVGLECEYYIDYTNWLKEEKERLQLDYIILGNHFPYREDKQLDFSKSTSKEMLKLYFKSSIEAMESGLYDYFAHPNLFMRGYRKVDDYSIGVMSDLACSARDLNILFEYNTTVRYDEVLWEKVAEHSPKVIIGLDIHDCQDLATVEQYDLALSLLKKAGITPINKMLLSTSP